MLKKIIYWKNQDWCFKSIDLMHKIEKNDFPNIFEFGIKDHDFFDNIVNAKKNNYIDLNLNQRIWISDKYFWYFNVSFFGNDFYVLALYKDINKISIVDDNNKTIMSLVAGSLVAGGLGAIANSINNSTKYFIHISFINGYIESYKCKNKSTAIQFYEVISKKIESKNLSINEDKNTNQLKLKLDEIKSLYESGVITKEEYESKRKQIIEKY